MRILVSGGAGFVGHALCQALLQAGYEIHVLDDLSTGFWRNVMPQAVFHQRDLAHWESWENLPKMDGIFHLGAMVSVPDSIRRPVRCFRVNQEGVIHAIRKALLDKARLIFASSAAVYGDGTGLQRESDLTLPKSPYGLSKLAGEHLLSMAEAEGLSWIAFRKFNIFGPNQALDSAYASVIPAFVSRLLESKPLLIHGSGQQTRDFVFIEQVVAYYLQALQSDFNGVLNLGNHQSLSVLALAQWLLEISGQDSGIEHIEARTGDIEASCADTTRLHHYFDKVEFHLHSALQTTYWAYVSAAEEKQRRD